MYLLGVDVGTSVIKTILFDLDGVEQYVAACESIVDHPEPVWAEQDMGYVWSAVQRTIREVVQESSVDPRLVAGIGLTGQGDGTWLVDRHGEPVRPAIIWLDGRAGELMHRFEREGASAHIFAITGTMPNTCSQGMQLRWLQEHEPESLESASAALRAKDWIFLCLTGLVTTDETDASFTYFDIRRRVYDDRLLTLYEIESLQRLLPQARPSYENQGSLLPEVAAQVGLLAGTPVVSGPFDVSASDLGVGALTPGEACTILGTAGIHQLVLDKPNPAPELIGYNICHALPNRWVRLLPTMTGTLNLQWFAREFFRDEASAGERNGRSSWEQLEALAGEVSLGSSGVIYHPYIDPAGERAPFLLPEARAQFSGLTASHTRQIMLRAVYEGVVLSALDCYQLLAPAISNLKLGGGGAKSKLWSQMFADALGRPVLIMGGKEFGAKGAAINAAVALGIFPSFDECVSRMVHPAREYRPDPAHTPIYREMLRLYRQTYRAMTPVWEESRNLRQSVWQGRPSS